MVVVIFATTIFSIILLVKNIFKMTTNTVTVYFSVNCNWNVKSKMEDTEISLVFPLDRT
ncbi:unknown [Clostridium sp. CAG:411]|nr:unknown [Clostridium sp. CAG:411]